MSTLAKHTAHESLPKRFKQFRQHLSKTQTEFGMMLDVRQTTVGSIENGTNDMTMKMAYQLIDLGCNPTWLMLGEGPMMKTADTSPTVEVRKRGEVTEYIVRVK